MNNVVLKGKLGAGFNDDRYTLPKDGNPGDILVKTETGSAWQKQEPATSTPDYNQNNPTASDYIKNRPGGYTVNYPALNIEWDGVIGDRVSVDVNGIGKKLVKVSDEIPKIEQLVGGTVSINQRNGYKTISITDNMLKDYGNGIYGYEALFVVNKAPANIVHPSTGSVIAVFPETGVYFAYGSQGEMTAYTSSLSLPAKSEIVPIPGELTNIVGGYVGKEKNEPLIDAVVPASSFELYTTQPKTYYEAPITLGFTPADGDLIRGTINDVEVNGSWIGILKCANLYRVGNRDVPFCVIGFHSEKAVISLQQASAPTTDYELHLYRYVPASIVQIPQEYVEGLEETTANAYQALDTATAAQSTANTANSKADSAQSTANTAKITAESAQNSADAAKSIAVKKEDRACGIIWHNSSYYATNIVYGNGIYVAKNANDTFDPFYSEDAISWNNIDLHLTNSYWKIAYGQGKFIILQKLSNDSGTAIYTSTDGKTWIKHNDQSGMYSDTVQYIDELWVAYTKGVSVSNSGLWYSEDGINWSQSNINSGRIFGVAKSANKWVVIHPTTGIYYSEDGKTYTLSNLTGKEKYGVIRYANGVFVYAYKDTVHYSENGETWVQATSNDAFPSDITDAMYEDGIWVMTAGNHIPMYSADGKTWSNGTGTYSWSRYLSYGGGTWVAYDNGISSSDKDHPPIYSKDGVNWNKCNIAESYINKPAYADGIWIVSSRYSEYNNVRGIFYSFDAANWYKLASIDEEYLPDAYNINGVWRCKSYYSVDKYLSRETANDKLAELNSQLDNLSKKISGDVIINSSTPDSTKKFKITVDDTGAISATEVT